MHLHADRGPPRAQHRSVWVSLETLGGRWVPPDSRVVELLCSTPLPAFCQFGVLRVASQ
jgi:hypothetical protein